MGGEAEPMRPQLADLMLAAIRKYGRDRKVGLLLSGGLDSVSVGILLGEAGHTVTAYTYELEGYRSLDRPKAERIAKHFGWPLQIITVPSASVRNDFLRLAIDHGCRKKVQFEVTQPLLHLFPCIDETEVWTGFNADDHYGNTRQSALEQYRLKKAGVSAAEQKAAFDRRRDAAYLETKSPGSTWCFAQKAAGRFGKRLLDPYLDDRLRTFFRHYDYRQLSPLKKPLIRLALEEHLRGLPESSIAVGVQLHTGGGVDALFRLLLDDPTINHFDPPYRTVSALCQGWGREVRSAPARLQAQLKQTGPVVTAKVRVSGRQAFSTYTMADVRAASAQHRFEVFSTFSGGGGSSIGLSLAGGRVRVALEFVPEAARTYQANFPASQVIQEDIRALVADKDRLHSLLRSSGLASDDIDILEGSPPCSEFSSAGRGLSDQNELRSYSDVTQRALAMLPFDFIDLASLLSPKVVILENVPGLTHAGKKHVLSNLLQALCCPAAPLNPRREYFVNYRILSSADYGTPQKRRRLFIVGIRRDVGEATGIVNDEQVSVAFPSATSSEISIRDALKNLQQTQSDASPWERAAAVHSTGRLIRLLPKNPTRYVRLGDVDPSYRGRGNFGLTRCAWDLPAPTLAVMGQRPDALSGALHPEEDRKFTLPELKRLFALPDDFVLTGTLRQASERVCRMVPPLMAKAIGHTVYQNVLLPYREKKNATR